MNLKHLCTNLIFIAMLFLPQNLMAETVTDVKNQLASKSEQIMLLEAQLKSIEAHQSQLISIVLWSLSAVIAMALGLAAFNWYTSKVSYEREIHAINQESNSKFQELHSELQSNISEHSKSIMTELESKEDEIKKSVIKELQKKLDKQTATLNQYKDRILGLEYDNKERLAKEAI